MRSVGIAVHGKQDILHLVANEAMLDDRHLRIGGAHHVHTVVEDDLWRPLPAHHAQLLLLILVSLCDEVCFGCLQAHDGIITQYMPLLLPLFSIHKKTLWQQKGSLQGLIWRYCLDQSHQRHGTTDILHEVLYNRLPCGPVWVQRPRRVS